MKIMVGHVKRDPGCESLVLRSIPIAVRAYALDVAKRAARSRLENVFRGVMMLGRSEIFSLKVGGRLVHIRPRDPWKLYVSDLVSLAAYGRPPRIVIEDKEARTLYRGLVFHNIVESSVEHGSFFRELHLWIPLNVGDTLYELHGTPDIVLIDDDGDAVVVELKSSERESTMAAGILQAMIYRRLLEDNMITTKCSCLATPSKTICITKKIPIIVIEHLASEYLRSTLERDPLITTSH
jgi:hypothetical protein